MTSQTSPKNAPKVLVILTGGTIDSEAYPDPDNPPKFCTPLAESLVPSALKALQAEGKISVNYETFDWSKKEDSQKFSVRDLVELQTYILKRHKEEGINHVVITHGTSAMCRNAALLKKFITKAAPQMRVLFTGAMTPLGNGDVAGADAKKNLIYAMNTVTTMKPDLCIGFQEKLFDPFKSYKDEEYLKFVAAEDVISKFVWG